MSEYIPITYKIRERMEQAERIIPIMDGAQYTQVRINLAWLTERLDEIDSVHAALERENERLHEQAAQVVRNIGGDAE